MYCRLSLTTHCTIHSLCILHWQKCRRRIEIAQSYKIVSRNKFLICVSVKKRRADKSLVLNASARTVGEYDFPSDSPPAGQALRDEREDGEKK